MNQHINKTILLGVALHAPVLQKASSGQPVATFHLVTSEDRQTKTAQTINEREEHTIVCWGGLAKFVKGKVFTGSLVYLEGRIRSYKPEGFNHRRYEIVAETVRVLSPVVVISDVVTNDAPSTDNHDEFAPLFTGSSINTPTSSLSNRSHSKQTNRLRRSSLKGLGPLNSPKLSHTSAYSCEVEQ